MNISSRLPAQYLCELRVLRWIDVAWGLDRHFISAANVVEYALWRASDASTPAEIHLATVDPRNAWQIKDILDQVAASETSESGESADRWQFALLQHSYETAIDPESLLRDVEDMFCQFGHPSDMYDFVSYMPPQGGYDPGAHSAEHNRLRLVRLLHDYLVGTAKAFGGRPPRHNEHW